jgi:hypothetical protein
VTYFRRAREPGSRRSEPSGGPRYLFVARFSATDAMLLRELASQIAEFLGAPDEAAEPGEASKAGRPYGTVEPEAGGTVEATLETSGTAETIESGGADESGDRGLFDDLADSLGLTEDAVLPDDPALARLLPDAYPDDPDASGEFRRYTERDLRAGKVAAAKTVLATLPAGGGRVSLSEPQAQTWLRTLNDIRLALGVRLGITEEMDRVGPDDPRFGALAVYDWLSGMQESLVHALW